MVADRGIPKRAPDTRYPKLVGQYPKLVGQYPKLYPNIVGQCPNLVGQHPNLVGEYPNVVGNYLNLVSRRPWRIVAKASCIMLCQPYYLIMLSHVDVLALYLST